MKSMTGFAQKRFTLDDSSINISIKSLNHRFLDLNFKGTGITPSSEKLIKELVKDKVLRGKLEITFDLFEKDPQNWNIQFNEYLLEEILIKLVQFNKKYKENVTLSMDSFLKIPMIFRLDHVHDKFSDEKIAKISEAVQEVIDDFIESRASEGKYIQHDIEASLKIISDHCKLISEKSQEIEKDVFNNLKTRINRFLDNIEIEEKRILQEAAIAAEKSCVAEEINRLVTHTQRLTKLVNNTDTALKGREADFLAQEMLRETHTISSKTTSLDIHESVLSVRREIEKIKQQVQNIE